jgi:hypothetical protein
MNMTRETIGIIALAILLGITTPGSGDIIPLDRSTTWNPGLNAVGGIPNRTTVCVTVSASDYGNGAQNATPGIQAAVDNCPEGRVVQLSAGEFKIVDHILIDKGLTLRGQGPGLTKLKKPATGNDPLIVVSAQRWVNLFQSTDLSSNGVKGSQAVTLAGNPGLTVGELVIIDQLTDTSLIEWGSGCPNLTDACRGWFSRQNRPLGQVLEVASINGNNITFTTPLHIDFKTTSGAQLTRFGEDWSGRVIPAVKYAGIEDLYVYGGDSGGHGNILFSVAAYSWAKNIESDYHNGHSVALYHTFRCVVRDSYIHSTQNPNPGGGGYGLVFSNYASDNLAENNIVWNMNKVMVMQASGGGNVIAYNYMEDGRIGYQPAWMESGLNASHMAGSHMELFEGNQSFNFDGETTWGAAIYITAFRNYLTGKRRSFPPLQFPYDQFRRAVSLWYGHWWYTFVGNVLGTAGQIPDPSSSFVYEDFYPWEDDPVAMWKLGIGDNWGPADPQVADTVIRDGNYDYVTNQVRWDNASQSVPSSLYLTGKPAFFGNCTWPWVNAAGSTKVHTLPAQARFEAGTPNTPWYCEGVDTTPPAAPRNLRLSEG